MFNVFKNKQSDKVEQRSNNDLDKNLGKDSMQKLILAELPSLRRYAYSLTQNQHDMEDLLQALVEKLLVQSIPADVKPLPWMLRVAKNLWIDELRKQKSKGTEIAVEEFDVAASDNIEGDFNRNIELQRMQKAIAQLPDNQREVLSLVTSAEMSYADAAAILDVPIGTIMSRLARARENLSKLLTP